VEDADTRRVFLAFILTDLPVGLRGLLVAGLFAAAMSSTDSALNAMSSSVVVDLGVGGGDPTARTGRTVNALCGGALVVAACGFALGDAGREAGLIPFALGVMVYAYAGLLAVFVGVLLLRRGGVWSVRAALLSGAAVVGALQFTPGLGVSLGWRMTLGFAVALVVCVLGGRGRDAW
jgi:SSS family solute:Na+ symporter